MAVAQSDIEKWLSSGWQLATLYYPKLNSLDKDYRGDFDYLYYIADNPNPKPTHVGFAIESLKKKTRSLSDLKAKEQLNVFISSSAVLFFPKTKEKAEDKLAEVTQWLKDNNRVPDPKAVQKEYRKLYSTDSEGKVEEKGSLWQRFNNKISDIGIWIAAFLNTAPDILTWIMIGLIVIAAIFVIIYALVTDGFWVALLTSVLCVIAGFIAFYAFGFVLFLLMFLILAIRYIFYNAYTLIATIVLFLLYALL